MNIEYPSAFHFIFHEDLYLSDNDRGSLIANRAKPPVVEVTTVTLNYLGGDKKKFLVVVYYPAEEFIKDDHLIALQSILKRLGFDLDDVALINIAKYPGVEFAGLMEFFNPQKLLLLGNLALPAGIGSITLNAPAVLNNISTLYSFSFEEMMDDIVAKKVFWEQIKQL